MVHTKKLNIYPQLCYNCESMREVDQRIARIKASYHSPEWIMETGKLEVDAMVARELRDNYGMRVEVRPREVTSRDDTVGIFGMDDGARETFWKIAQTPRVVRLSTAHVLNSSPRPRTVRRRLELVKNTVVEVMLGRR